MDVVCDSSSLISIVSVCFAQSIKRLVKKLNIDLHISNAVFKECVERPIKTKRYELSAIRLKQAVSEGWIVLHDFNLKKETKRLQKIANNVFLLNNKPLELVHKGEAESLALLKNINAKVLLIDERTTRMIIEDPYELAKRLSRKYSSDIKISEKSLKKFRRLIGNVTIIRSSELVAMCFEQDLLNLPKQPISLEAALYAVKFAGCAVAGYEIDNYVKKFR